MARHFSELVAWQLSAQLRDEIVAFTARPNVSPHRRFCDQMRDAIRSATDNIAEGFGRYAHADFARFLSIALGSLGEVQSQLYDAQARRLLARDDYIRMWRLSVRAIRATSALQVYLRRSNAPEPGLHPPPDDPPAKT